MDFEILFRSLTEKNVLCRRHGFRFMMVSDLEGFSDALESMKANVPLVCLSDCTSGAIDIDNAPSVRTIRTVFLYMPHPLRENYQKRRQEALSTMREIFRQFMTVLLLEVTNLRMDGIYLDRQVMFTEIDRYFFSGGACAYFQITTDKATDLVLRKEEWTDNPIPYVAGRLDVNMPRRSTGHSSTSGPSDNINFSESSTSEGDTGAGPES